MKRKGKQSESTRLTLLELIISIGVFAIISVFLLEMFLAANSMQQQAKDEGKAITKSETVAELIKGADSQEEVFAQLSMQEAWGTMQQKKNGTYQIVDVTSSEDAGKTKLYVAHFDKNWKETEEEDCYSLILVPYEENLQGKTVNDYEIFVYCLNGYASILNSKESVELYHLSFSDYKGGGVDIWKKKKALYLT